VAQSAVAICFFNQPGIDQDTNFGRDLPLDEPAGTALGLSIPARIFPCNMALASIRGLGGSKRFRGIPCEAEPEQCRHAVCLSDWARKMRVNELLTLPHLT
jgi:hypothetical protein